MKTMTIDWRPSALPAASTPVSGVSGPHAALMAVVGGLGVGTPQIQARRAQVLGCDAAASGLKLEDTAKVDKTFGDVRGVPPRGRPV